ncbi:MAG TPA: tetratricopeptide repeat protein, partial [Candidatus Angelobacter sp.]|nr:tetratricopeptide repeat protein [Candidatus Angelobacter sp.]
MIFLVGCRGGESTTWSDLYSSSRRLLDLGDKDSLAAAEAKADQGFRESAPRDPVWNWKFRVLKAEMLVWRGKAKDVLALLSVPPPTELSKSEFAVRAKLAEGLADISLDHREQARLMITQAEELASVNTAFMLSQVSLYRGVLAMQEEKYDTSQKQLLKALDLARLNGNHFVESQALSNLAGIATKTGHFDEAIDYFLKCKAIAQTSGYAYQEHIQLANLLWNYLELGDLPKAVSSYSKEEKSIDSFEPILRKSVFDDLGAVYRAKEDYPASKRYYLKAYEVADQIQRAGDSNVIDFMARVQNSLAEVALDEGNIEEAVQHSLQVRALHGQGLEFDLTSARVGIAKREFENARLQLEKIIKNEKAESFIRWQAQAELANLYVAQNDAPGAERQYQKAIDSFENTHIVLSNEENKMAFFQKSARVYDQYIGLLLAENKPFEALKVAESNRAHSLAEGLGLKDRIVAAAMNLPGIQSFLGKRHSVVLAYWLGNKRSIAWVVAPKGFQFFTLPARRDIAKLVD